MSTSKNDNRKNEGKNDRRSETSGKNSDQVNKEQEQVSSRDQNKKWDQAQRRHQASPRGYGENVDSQNTENQNTLADKEQIDQPTQKENPNDPKKIGDQISQRQQTMDGGDPPENKKENNQ